jgi:hypothetical protein
MFEQRRPLKSGLRRNNLRQTPMHCNSSPWKSRPVSQANAHIGRLEQPEQVDRGRGPHPNAVSPASRRGRWALRPHSPLSRRKQDEALAAPDTPSHNVKSTARRPGSALVRGQSQRRSALPAGPSTLGAASTGSKWTPIDAKRPSSDVNRASLRVERPPQRGRVQLRCEFLRVVER